jgi:hypothetical protein
MGDREKKDCYLSSPPLKTTFTISLPSSLDCETPSIVSGSAGIFNNRSTVGN